MRFTLRSDVNCGRFTQLRRSAVTKWLVLLCAGSVAVTDAAAARQAAPRTGPTFSRYVPMRDGVRLAVDVWMPAGPNSAKVPTLLMFTRYWRSFRANKAPRGEIMEAPVKHFTGVGYAVAIVDVRGTGASFGSRATEFSREEVDDMGEVIDWIASQAWSNGRVATIGTSYGGNTAELSAISARPELRATVPRFSDFSEYEHAFRPGGIRNAVIADAWVQLTAALDANDPCAAVGPEACTAPSPWSLGVNPVADDPDGRLLAMAVREHIQNANLGKVVAGLTYTDDTFERSGRSDVTLHTVSPSSLWREIDRAGVPSFHWASWFDGGTAEGALTRFINYRTPLRVVIGAWNHGGTLNADPYVGAGNLEAIPTPTAQHQSIQQFLDPLMKDSATPGPNLAGGQRGVIEYFTIGANRWRTTSVWPPVGIRFERYYLQAGNRLAAVRPPDRGTDPYTVDFSSTTGRHNRWHTQLGAPFEFVDRSGQDRKALVYVSAPLVSPVEITGSPIAHVLLDSSTPDGALFVYLEDEAPDGRVTYLTGGGLRLRFHGVGRDRSGTKHLGPVHTFTRAEARAVRPGETILLRFGLNPISALVDKNHRIRVAMTGADADTFERLPAAGPPPRFVIKRGKDSSSYVELPMVRER